MFKAYRRQRPRPAPAAPAPTPAARGTQSTCAHASPAIIKTASAKPAPLRRRQDSGVAESDVVSWDVMNCCWCGVCTMFRCGVRVGCGDAVGGRFIVHVVAGYDHPNWGGLGDHSAALLVTGGAAAAQTLLGSLGTSLGPWVVGRALSWECPGTRASSGLSTTNLCCPAWRRGCVLPLAAAIVAQDFACFRSTVEAKLEELDMAKVRPSAAELRDFGKVVEEFGRIDVGHLRICTGFFCKKGCPATRERILATALLAYRYFAVVEEEDSQLRRGLSPTEFSIKAAVDDILVRVLVQKREFQRQVDAVDVEAAATAELSGTALAKATTVSGLCNSKPKVESDELARAGSALEAKRRSSYDSAFDECENDSLTLSAGLAQPAEANAVGRTAVSSKALKATGRSSADSSRKLDANDTIDDDGVVA